MSFDSALSFVLAKEGGFVNDPADPGGATNKGVTQLTYDGYRAKNRLPKRDVRQIQNTEVRDIYRSIWDSLKCDLLPAKTAEVLFDFAVNSGVSRAAKKLQALVGLKEDGLIGTQSINVLKHHVDTELASKLLDAREAYYHSIALGPKQKFLNGWLNRLTDLRTHIA